MHEKKSCSRCECVFECKAGTITQCQCYALTLTLEERIYIEEKFTDCLCSACLAGIKKRIQYFEKRNLFLDECLVADRAVFHQRTSRFICIGLSLQEFFYMFDPGQISFKQIVTISFTLFAVIDMLGSIPVLVSLKEKIGGTIRSTQATVVSGLLMIVFLFFGQQFLNLLSLDVRSFAVAGSIVIFILGLEMVLGMEFFKNDKNTRGSSVVPIAFPIIAGSGTLTTIMSLKANYADINILISILSKLYCYLYCSKIAGLDRKSFRSEWINSSA